MKETQTTQHLHVYIFVTMKNPLRPNFITIFEKIIDWMYPWDYHLA